MKIRQLIVFGISAVMFLGNVMITKATIRGQEVLLYEDFSKGNDGQLLSELSEWHNVNTYIPQGQSNNNLYTITSQSDNKIARFYKGPNSGESRLWIARSLNTPQNAEKVTISFKIRTQTDSTTMFDIGFRSKSKDWWPNGHIRLVMGGSCVSLLKADGSAYDYYYDKLIAQKGTWNTVEIVFDDEYMQVVVNGKKSGGITMASAKSLEGEVPVEIAFGFQRQQAVGSLVEIDDLIGTVERNSTVLVSQPEFYLDYGHEQQKELTCFTEGIVTGSVEYFSQKDNSSVTSIMALYGNDGRLIRVKSETEKIRSAGVVGRLQCTLDTTGGTDAVMLLWDNMSNGQPLLKKTSLNYDGIIGDINGTFLQDERIYYVSPNGLDTNPGTEEKPFKSLAMAATTAKAGSTVLLKDGTYYENCQTVVKYSGTEEKPIVFKAENLLKAQIIYPASIRLKTKFLIEKGKNYITVQGLTITQEATATENDRDKTSDILYACYGDHCSIIGNKLYHAYEEGIKFYLAQDVLIANNIVTDMIHEAIDLVNCADVIIRNNDLSEVGRVGVFGKGGTRNMLVYNNYIHNKERKADIALCVGGSTDAPWCYDVAEGTGYENYNSVYYNNIIHAEEQGAFINGIAISAPKNAYIYNNIVLGADVGYLTSSGGGMKKGWPWWPDVVNVDVKNNIFYKCGKLANENLTATNFSFENNLIWQTPGIPKDGKNIEGDPLFVDPNSDWHLKDGSPAKDAGIEWPEFPAFGGGTQNVPNFDYAGMPYEKPWDIGVYNY